MSEVSSQPDPGKDKAHPRVGRVHRLVELMAVVAVAGTLLWLMHNHPPRGPIARWLLNSSLWILVLLASVWGTCVSLIPYYVGQRGTEVVFEHYPNLEGRPWERLKAVFQRWGAPTLILKAVNAFQDGFRLSLLSDWGGESHPAAFAFDSTVDMKTPPLTQVNTMSAEQFFTYGLKLMELHPPHVTDGSMLLRMERIGLKVGASFDYSALDSSIKSALSEGMRAGLEEMENYISTRSKPRDGWATHPGPIGVYGNDYLGRAVIAMIGLGANPPEDAIYPVCVSDANGDPVRGEKRYTLHFAADNLPPVGAFWSLTMYDHEGFPVPNALDRYAIGDRDALVYNADGSLDIYIQHESPGSDKESNWLPSPATGELGLTMRLYEPMPAILSGTWSPPPLVKAD